MAEIRGFGVKNMRSEGEGNEESSEAYVVSGVDSRRVMVGEKFWSVDRTRALEPRVG